MSFAAVVTGVVSVGTAIASGVAKGNLASKQKREAEKLRKNSAGITADKINNVYLDNKTIAENKAMQGLAGKDLMNQKLIEQSANAFNQSRLATNNSGDLLSAISAQNKTATDKALELEILNAEAKQKGLADIQNQNLIIGGEKARLEAIAEQKRANIRKQAGALEGASTENESAATQEIIGGIGSGVGSAIGMINAKNEKSSDQNFLTSLFGGDKKSGIAETKVNKSLFQAPDYYDPLGTIANQDRDRALDELGTTDVERIAAEMDFTKKGIPLSKKEIFPIGKILKKSKKK